VARFGIAHIDDIQPLEGPGECPITPVRHHFGIGAFGVNAWTAKSAGDRIIPEHDEDEPDAQEELYVVTRGHAVFELDGERHDAPEGTYVFAPPGVKRTALAEDAGTTVLAIGATPGKAYEVVGWELWHPLRKLYESGANDEVIARLREMVAEAPGYGLLFYNLACCESVVGQKDEAIEHLRRAFELSDKMREFAKGDSDLDALRDEPAFRELIAG
jgi:tetratricopeptide (TPR) repeat protein